ncbi:uncharacterized protein PAC_02792 [Phialocephala subalpina]|uniref:Protein kinase domain-containing protein n=1 Tax=Phialocephala subalpina TaxID=576137 RepID=A0A1L7WJG0_9HELO|nr:uncharacterized protein PAC_02792 [Phialocephala subalpina]
MFLASGNWNPLAPSSDNALNPLFGLLDSVLSLSVGLSVAGSVCSKVALEAALDEVGSVLVTGVRLRSWHKVFCARDKREEYGVGRHLEEMVGLCGPFPKSLLEKGDEQLVKEAFDEGGYLKINKLGKVVGLEQRCASVDPKERSKFVAFIKRILVLDPEKRPRAKKLLKDEWLKHNYDEDVSPFEPAALKPVARKPVAHKPVAHKPVAHKPVAHKPVAYKTVAHP